MPSTWPTILRPIPGLRLPILISRHGVTYSNASSPKPSDSFPGVLALVTGGSPVSTGIWYDDSFDRLLAPPLNNSQAALSGTCTPGVFHGAEVRLDETLDRDLTKLTKRWSDGRHEFISNRSKCFTA